MYRIGKLLIPLHFSPNAWRKTLYSSVSLGLFSGSKDYCGFIQIFLVVMKSKLNAFFHLPFMLSATQNFNKFSNAYPFERVICCHRSYATTPALAVIQNSAEKVEATGNKENPIEVHDVLSRWGCTENDISIIFIRHPSLRKMDVNNLQSKLQILRSLGISSSSLLKMIQCRPRFLNVRLSKDLEERIQYLQSLFGSKEVLLKALLRNPSLLNYDLHDKVKLVVATFENVGVGRGDLIRMLLSRPTLIPRCILNDEKMDYIRRTGVSKDSRTYKYVVTIFSVSRIETICEKIANLEKFGFSEDEVLNLFGHNPLILTFSIDKIQRNMTYILGTMKLPARTVLSYPRLLCYNLERQLKPRFSLAQKIDYMGLTPRISGPSMVTAFRMTEKRFIKAFINCHPEAVAQELMLFYVSAKCIKRLAESSKKCTHNGFPF